MNKEYRDGPQEPRREEFHREFRKGPRPERPLRPDFRNDRPEKPERPERSFRPRRPRFKQVTRLFTSKEELVEYVNVEGEKGHQIDVYKIEENLYKVVKVDRPQPEDVE